MNNSNLIENTRRFVRETLKDGESGHDWQHAERVWKTAKELAKGMKVDTLVVELAALLHDIADPKFHDNDETIGPRIAMLFLDQQDVNDDVIEHVLQIIDNVSFKGGNVKRSFSSIELDLVQDADRLDAIGAVGIARTFNYGGFKNRPIYDPNIEPNLEQTKEQYRASTAPTINHFYEKLLLLKDLMNTDAARKVAEQRHRFMENFLQQFFREWDGKA